MQPSKQGNKLNLIANPSKPSTTRILFTSAFTYTSTCYEIFIDSLCLLLARGAGHKALLWCLKLWLDHYERFHIMAHQGSPTDMTMMTCKDPEGTRGKACYWFEIFQKTSKYVQMCGELCFLWDIALKPHHKGIALFAHQVHLAFNKISFVAAHVAQVSTKRFRTHQEETLTWCIYSLCELDKGTLKRQRFHDYSHL